MRQIDLLDERSCDIISKVCREELAEHGPQSVTIQKLDESIRESQRRLIWVFETQIGKVRKWDKEEVHRYHKEKFAIPIYERDKPGFTEMMQSIHNVKVDRGFSEYSFLLNKVIDLVSTKDLTVKQCREYLTEIDHDAADKGIALEKPEDIYNKAMGRSRKKPTGR